MGAVPRDELLEQLGVLLGQVVALGAVLLHVRGDLHPGRAVRRALALHKNGRLKYTYNYLGLVEQDLVADMSLPTGPCVLGVEFTKENQTPSETTGTFTLFVGDKATATLKDAKIQNGKFNLCGEGLNIGRDGGAPVTLDYPGSRPWGFSGGTIQQVIVDVSGEPYLDLEKEALGMMKRD